MYLYVEGCLYICMIKMVVIQRIMLLYLYIGNANMGIILDLYWLKSEINAAWVTLRPLRYMLSEMKETNVHPRGSITLQQNFYDSNS